jgi:hypothetical protein
LPSFSVEFIQSCAKSVENTKFCVVFGWKLTILCWISRNLAIFLSSYSLMLNQLKTAKLLWFFSWNLTILCWFAFNLTILLSLNHKIQCCFSWKQLILCCFGWKLTILFWISVNLAIFWVKFIQSFVVFYCWKHKNFVFTFCVVSVCITIQCCFSWKHQIVRCFRWNLKILC